MKIEFLIIILSLLFFDSSRGESLLTVDTDTVLLGHTDCAREKSCWDHRISAFLDSSLALVGTVTGIYARPSWQDKWQKTIDCIVPSKNWWEVIEQAKKANAPFYPGHFWRDRQTGNILLLDRRSSSVFGIIAQDDSFEVEYYWQFNDRLKDLYCKNICTYDGSIILSCYLPNRKIAVATVSEDISDYRKIYECPSSLISRGDSLSWGGVSPIPAFNPVDSTIWIAFEKYNYLYVVGMNGRFQDSIAISGADYRPPQPLRSRVKSKAVSRDWYSRFTPVISLTYIPPGYFMLQYNTGWEKCGSDSIPLYTTAAWTTERQPVQLQIDKRWQLAGVSTDGRVLFATYGDNNQACFIELNTVRIMP